MAVVHDHTYLISPLVFFFVKKEIVSKRASHPTCDSKTQNGASDSGRNLSPLRKWEGGQH